MTLTDAETRKLIQYYAKIVADWAPNNFSATKESLLWQVERMRELVNQLEDK